MSYSFSGLNGDWPSRPSNQGRWLMAVSYCNQRAGLNSGGKLKPNVLQVWQAGGLVNVGLGVVLSCGCHWRQVRPAEVDRKMISLPTGQGTDLRSGKRGSHRSKALMLNSKGGTNENV